MRPGLNFCTFAIVALACVVVGVAVGYPKVCVVIPLLIDLWFGRLAARRMGRRLGLRVIGFVLGFFLSFVGWLICVWYSSVYWWRIEADTPDRGTVSEDE